MVVRNVVRSPVRAVVQSVFGEGESFHPFQLFTSGAQGAWYDPSDFSTLYQDAAGTTPVTAVEQPVRLMLDRSKGLVLGSELVTNGGFDTDSDWLTNPGWGITGGAAVCNNTSGVAQNIEQSISIVANRSYRVSFTISSYVSGNVRVRFAGGTNVDSDTFAANGSYSVVINSVSGNNLVALRAANATALSVDNVSVRELPGNHATAPNDASRPVLRARYNLLTFSEQFDNGVWTKNRATITANAGVAPDGTTTADKLVEDSTAANNHRTFQNVTTVAASYTATIYAKAAERSIMYIRMDRTATTPAVWFNLATGTVGTQNTGMTGSITALPNGWYRCQATLDVAVAGTNSILFGLAITDGASDYTGDGTSGILIWGAQLLTAADHAATGGAYQRIGSATDYDTGPPWRPYLAFDGSDDSMSTSSIDFSGTDKMTVFAGVTKLSDAVGQVVFELSADSISNNGTFAAFSGGNEYIWRSRGTTTRTPVVAGYNAPTTNVLTGIGDISGDVATLRIDGTQAATNTDDQGTGNYGNHPLFIGRRNNTSQPFNGRLYSLAVLGRTATAAELGAMETWIAGKTGVTI